MDCKFTIESIYEHEHHGKRGTGSEEWRLGNGEWGRGLICIDTVIEMVEMIEPGIVVYFLSFRFSR